MTAAATPPSGFVAVGGFKQSLPCGNGPAVVIDIMVYVKQ